MDFSMEIPLEKSREFSPLQSVHIENIEHVGLKKEVHQSELSTSQTKGFQLGAKAEVNSIWTGWVPTSMAEEDYSSDSEGEKFDSPNSYKKILLGDIESTRLIQKFLQEPFGLKQSKVTETDFSIEACFNRLASYGYRVKMVNYKSYEIEEITVKVNHLDVEWHRGTSATSVRFEELTGIILGDSSSTFQKYKQVGGNLGRYSIQSTDCISVLSKFRNFDFATTDDQAKYDIYTVLSWKISSSSNHGPLIPINKGVIATIKIRMKLKELAKSKFLFLKELILLGLMKHHVINKSSNQKLLQLKQIIDKKLKLDQKMYRISQLMKPWKFRVTQQFSEKFDNSQRTMTLQKRIANNAFIKDAKIKKFIRENEKMYDTSRSNVSKLFKLKSKESMKSIPVSVEEKFQYSMTKSVCTPK